MLCTEGIDLGDMCVVRSGGNGEPRGGGGRLARHAVRQGSAGRAASPNPVGR